MSISSSTTTTITTTTTTTTTNNYGSNSASSISDMSLYEIKELLLLNNYFDTLKVYKIFNSIKMKIIFVLCVLYIFYINYKSILYVHYFIK